MKDLRTDLGALAPPPKGLGTAVTSATTGKLATQIVTADITRDTTLLPEEVADRQDKRAQAAAEHAEKILGTQDERAQAAAEHAEKITDLQSARRRKFFKAIAIAAGVLLLVKGLYSEVAQPFIEKVTSPEITQTEVESSNQPLPVIVPVKADGTGYDYQALAIKLRALGHDIIDVDGSLNTTVSPGAAPTANSITTQQALELQDLLNVLSNNNGDQNIKAAINNVNLAVVDLNFPELHPK
jgi:hypothetical protein